MFFFVPKVSPSTTLLESLSCPLDLVPPSALCRFSPGTSLCKSSIPDTYRDYLTRPPSLFRRGSYWSSNFWTYVPLPTTVLSTPITTLTVDINVLPTTALQTPLKSYLLDRPVHTSPEKSLGHCTFQYLMMFGGFPVYTLTFCSDS